MLGRMEHIKYLYHFLIQINNLFQFLQCLCCLCSLCKNSDFALSRLQKISVFKFPRWFHKMASRKWHNWLRKSAHAPSSLVTGFNLGLSFLDNFDFRQTKMTINVKNIANLTIFEIIYVLSYSSLKHFRASSRLFVF